MAAGQSSCGTCGTEPRVGARFCDACGAPIAQIEPATEYKQVTVLFADVVRSMDLAATLDPERLREVMAELFARCGAVVRRFGGTVDKFTGDGIMALFGAPVALEDHATRACLAALEIQRHGMAYAMRVGLDSGEVVTGQIGSHPTSYTAVGAHVGMAQRMESVAPPGGVMISEATARLVANTAVCGDLQMVEIKGSTAPVPARLLIAVDGRRSGPECRDSALIGRGREAAVIEGLLERADAGEGSVIGIAGPAGIGKSRVAGEVAHSARKRGMRIFSTYCESHASDIPFHVVARLLRDVFAIADLDDAGVLEQLLTVPATSAGPAVSGDARRRRLSEVLSDALAAQPTPTVVIVEDAHWLDDASEAILADAFAVVTRTRALAVVTHRPEYHGALLRTRRFHPLPLAPLDHSESSVLAAALLGPDPSVHALTDQIVSRAAGNPFFVHEIVRDLADRKVVEGQAGAYVHRGDPAEVTVPATLQAAIAARIDRLSASGKRTLNAAALIGSQFGADLLATLLEMDRSAIPIAELVEAELVDEIASPATEYAFRHPLIRAVASESQLKAVRTRLHRRLAEAIRLGATGDADDNAAQIGTHLEAAGDLRDAYDWYMRAGTWFTNRDIGAARTSWRRARTVADQLPPDETDRTSLRIVPRSLLCGSAWRAGASLPETDFDELRELCVTASSRIPLAMGMAGRMAGLSLNGRGLESSRLAPEYVALVDAIDDPTFAVGSLWAAIHAKYEVGAMTEVDHLAQRVIDLADGDPTKGNFLTGSPLAFATAMRGIARCCRGHDGWRADFDEANAIAREVDPTTYVSTVMFKYSVGMAVGALVADDTALRETREALDIARDCSEDLALGLAQLARGLTLVHTGRADDRVAGLELLTQARTLADEQRSWLTEVPIIDAELAAESARAGDLDGAIELARCVVDDAIDACAPLYLGRAVTVLVMSLLRRGAHGDVVEARAAVDRVAAWTDGLDTVHHQLPLLRLRALLAHQAGDVPGYRRHAEQYRTMAEGLGFVGHMASARDLT
jgi:class 3 adenylate cyclase